MALLRGFRSAPGQTGEEALAVLCAKAIVEIATFTTAWRGAKGEAFAFANLAIEKLLPLHVFSVGGGERWEAFTHESGQFAALHKSKVLPKVARRHRPTRDDGGDPSVERGGVGLGSRQQFVKLRLLLVERETLGRFIDIEKLARAWRPLPCQFIERAAIETNGGGQGGGVPLRLVQT